VILADRDSESLGYEGLAEALEDPGTDLRIFAKPTSRPYRRMGVTLATAGDTDEARRKAREAAHKVHIVYKG
jgi:phosphoribosylglycinamide formyltransferase 2